MSLVKFRVTFLVFLSALFFGPMVVMSDEVSQPPGPTTIEIIYEGEVYRCLLGPDQEILVCLSASHGWGPFPLPESLPGKGHCGSRPQGCK